LSIWADGPVWATVAIVCDAPDKHDLKEGRPLGGATGRLFWPFFTQSTGLHRGQVYTTFLWKDPFDPRQEKDGLSEDEMTAAGAALVMEMAELPNLKYVLALGRHAARHFGFPARLEQTHGIPQRRERGWVMSGFHPSAALRDGTRLAFTTDDLDTFGELVAGRYEPGPERAPGRYEQITESFLSQLLDYGPYEIAIDTEFEGAEPLMLTFSVQEGQGWLILAEETKKLWLLARMLEAWKPVVYGHNWLADLPILKKMGIDLVSMGVRLRDTMAYAWYRQTEPQGLKPLAWRHLGVEVQGFEEVVAPYFNESLLAYLYAARDLTQPATFERRGKPSAKCPEGKLLKPGVEKASKIHQLVKRFLGDYEKGKVPDLHERWSKWEAERINQLTELVGPPPVFSLRHVPLDVTLQYAGADPDYTLSLAHRLPPYSEELAEMDHGRLPMIAAMSERGILVDLGRQRALLAELEAEQEGKLEILRILTDRPDFNPNSADHIAEVLYGCKKIAPGMREFMTDREYLVPPAYNKKSGAPKTDKKALGTLRGQGEYDLPAYFLDYKETEKLINTYVQPMPRFVDRDLVLHPNWRHTRVPSGRLASVRPNIMAIPARSDKGMKVRALFRARPGFKLVSFDHSQIELRLAACVTQDPVMMQAFVDGVDLHTLTAAKITGRDVADPFWKTHKGKQLRALFKTINFGILYGATAERIYLELLSMGIRDFSLEDVQRFHQQWFQLYEGVERHLRLVEHALQHQGYVEDMWGRRRKLPGARLTSKYWPASALREEAIRQGFNHQIQGGAQGLLTNAMLRFWYSVMPAIRSMGAEVYALLQIHDELIFEISDREEVIEMFKELGLAAMIGDQDRFEVPIEAGVAVGMDWSELK
jgi:uracil-DNA glycosylase family 4